MKKMADTCPTWIFKTNQIKVKPIGPKQGVKLINMFDFKRINTEKDQPKNILFQI